MHPAAKKITSLLGSIEKIIDIFVGPLFYWRVKEHQTSWMLRFGTVWKVRKTKHEFINSKTRNIDHLMGYALCRWPPIIAHCFRIADSWQCCKRILEFLGRKAVIWHDWWLHFGVLGDPGPILGDWGT